MNFAPVTAKAFGAMQNLDIAQLATCSAQEIRPLLPCLVRMSLLSPLDNTAGWVEARKQILSLLVGIEVVNNIVSLLQVNYHELEIDVKKEQQIRQKIGYTTQDSAQFHSLPNGIVMGFERADETNKVRVVLSELFYLQAQLNDPATQALLQKPCSSEPTVRSSELFDNEIFLEEIADIICIALAELPSLLNLQEVIETLLYVRNGCKLVCWIVANMPDCFREVVTALITNGDEETTDGRVKLAALYELSEMNPSQALSMRTICVETVKMPSLMIKLSLKDPQNLVAFVSGLLLGNDQNIRSSFAVYIRNNQKRKGEVLMLLREELLRQLQSIILQSPNGSIPEELVVQAAVIMRLYCALRGISGIKFFDEEIQLLMQLITSKPPPTPAGIRFVSLGLCMLIACPSLIPPQAPDNKVNEWIQWLIREEAYFENVSEVSASFGEMLLLMAIHFHSNQLTHICELACATLGMKLSLRPTTTTRIKHIFTHEIFTEQVVAAHAVKVPVTPNLNATIPGYLPVHCIHQLLKSRAFSKHKVPIKSWIYRQICNSVTPMHPVLPALIEVYVNSIIVPQQKGMLEQHTHKALSEQEIQQMFQNGPGLWGREQSHQSTPNSSRAASVARDGTKKDHVLHHPHHPPHHPTQQSVMEVDGESSNRQPNLTPQLLLLYYLLLYEDVRLANMAQIIATGRQVKSYSNEFMSELPIKYLLQQAQRNQQEYSALFSPLLRLLVQHFPHLSLVDDWIDEETIPVSDSSSTATVGPYISEHAIVEAFEEIELNPARTIKLLRRMMRKSPVDLWPLAPTFIRYFKHTLSYKIPLLLQELYRQVWMRLNTIFPRRLWVMSINALMPEDNVTKNFTLTQENILLDPLQVLRCDVRVFRCSSALTIVLRILQAVLAASSSQQARHLLDKPLTEVGVQVKTENDREELRLAMFASQASIAVQILLEACLENEEDRAKPGRLWALREVRGVICSYIHQVFIAEPSLAKLVHFQGYSRELLAMTVRGIPSMHICLDFIPELLSMTQMEKQIFAIDLTSHLALQYALPKSLGIAKLCMNVLTTLLGVLSSEIRTEMFRAVLPCIVRFAEAFPPLIDDCIMFLMQLGRIVQSQAALGRSTSLPSLFVGQDYMWRSQSLRLQGAEKLVEEVRETFSKLIDVAVLSPKIYSHSDA
ncbi:LOW QUALITY PROTEIN: integrator complex subunit 2-like [Anopheles albimanus]|uniref:LOW QUALITY PROTEIN: integrator complex subunit 2-like n=1 Tax=Anopheles albimanus TaxID=7167 RepID=UPI00164214AD|nr:LOW QUALITY PROTEIN: integrator complex subunit 2-like [Anopheles albimanus]